MYTVISSALRSRGADLFPPNPPAIFPPACPPSPFAPGGVVELPKSHRVPLSWLLEHGGESIRYRTLKEIAPPEATPADAMISETAQLAQFKSVAAIVKRQKESGIWGANLLATGASVKDGIKEAGTVPQYRRLLQLGLPTDHRA